MHETLTKIKIEREYRRDIKNELHRAEQFANSIGTNSNASLSTTAIRAIQRAEASTYRPRVLQDLFLNARDSHREVRCYHEMVARYETKYFVEKGIVDDMERTNTIYDGIKTDWDFFVQRQADFFRYAHQHVRNLEIDLRNIDNQIESTLSACEDARYNVAQGYTVFKRLKELRSERKQVILELRKVTAITDRFDCDVMRDIYDEIESEYAAEANAGTPLADDTKPIPEAV